MHGNPSQIYSPGGRKMADSLKKTILRGFSDWLDEIDSMPTLNLNDPIHKSVYSLCSWFFLDAVAYLDLGYERIKRIIHFNRYILNSIHHLLRGILRLLLEKTTPKFTWCSFLVQGRQLDTGSCPIVEFSNSCVFYETFILVNLM